MSGRDSTPEGEAPDDAEEPTVVAEPAVIDLRDGVDTVAAYEADRAEREAAAAAAKGASRPA